MADEISTAEWLRRYQMQRQQAQQAMMDAGMSPTDVAMWKRETATAPEERGQLPAAAPAAAAPNANEAALRMLMEKRNKLRGLGRE